MGVTFFLRRVRVLIIAVSFAFLLFAFPDQTLELYSELTQQLDTQNLIPLTIAAASIVALGVVLWCCADALLTKESPPEFPGRAGRTYDHCQRWGPWVIAILPALAVTLGLVEVLVTREPAEGSQRALHFVLAGAAVAVLAIILLISFLRHHVWPKEGDSAKIKILLLLGIGSFGAGLLLAFYGPAAQALGPLFSFALFIALCSSTLSVATYYGDLRNIPVLGLLLIFIVVLGVLDLNDNHHEIKHTILSKAESDHRADGPKSAADAFEKWLASRADRKEFEDSGRDYPVFIVAAQGGGLYAAYHAAMFLARMQDTCPSFAQHIFAISGVSGGAIGATMFTALASALATNGPLQPCRDLSNIVSQGPFEVRIDSALSRDFLSPVIARALFADLTQQLLPMRIGAFDRARALEESFSEALQVGSCDEPAQTKRLLDQSVFDYWKPEGAAPALLLNTTIVERGDQLIIAPILFDGHEDSGRPVFNMRSQRPDIDMSLSTAAVLSARFPIVTPAGWLRGGKDSDLPDKFRLVDGGYYDNSGIETALGLIRALKQAPPVLTRRTEFILIIFTHEYRVIFGRKADYFLGEIMSPVRAMLNARVSRGYNSSARRAHWEFPNNVLPLPLSEKLDETSSFTPPLGWFLSEETRNEIRARIGNLLHLRKDPCAPEDPRVEPLDNSSPTNARDVASQVIGDIWNKLSPW